MKNDIFLKKKNFEIEAIRNEIKELNIFIKKLELKILEKEEIYNERDKKIYEDIMTLLSKDLFLKLLIKEIESLKKEKESFEKLLENKKEILSKLLGEKKAYETYKEKIKKEKEKKENEKENRLANEIYTRKFFNN